MSSREHNSRQTRETAVEPNNVIIFSKCSSVSGLRVGLGKDILTTLFGHTHQASGTRLIVGMLLYYWVVQKNKVTVITVITTDL